MTAPLSAQGPYINYRLQKRYEAIRRDLEPDRILGYLYQEEVIDADDMEEVKAERTRKKKAEKLLEILQGKARIDASHNAMEVFVDILDQRQPHLARILQTQIDGECNGKTLIVIPQNFVPKTSMPKRVLVQSQRVSFDTRLQIWELVTISIRACSILCIWGKTRHLGIANGVCSLENLLFEQLSSYLILKFVEECNEGGGGGRGVGGHGGGGDCSPLSQTAKTVKAIQQYNTTTFIKYLPCKLTEIRYSASCYNLRLVEIAS